MGTTKFKIGDKVRILDGSEIENYTHSWICPMEDHVGEEKDIETVLEDGYRLYDMGYIWDERGLERVDQIMRIEDGQCVCITGEGEIYKREAWWLDES